MADTTAILDLISPANLGSELITITPSTTQTLYANQPITVDIDYSGAGDAGVELPIDFEVQPAFGAGGKANGYLFKTFRFSPLAQYTFTVPGGGQYLVVVRERWHNRSFGRLLLTVEGDDLSAVTTSRS